MNGTLRDRLAVATAVVALAVGCVPRPLVERAIRARGGPVGTVVLDAEAEVRRGYPGTWRWRRVFATPDRYAWTIVTTGEPLHHLFDGTVVRAFIGGALTAVDASPTAPLRSQARFVAVSLLDVLHLPGIQVMPMALSDLPAGATGGLTVAFPAGGERYTVLLDDRLLPIRVEGPIDFSPMGRGRLVARQDDFRPVAGVLLPHHVVWELDGQELADERAQALCVRVEPLPVDAFADPSRLPDCPAPPAEHRSGTNVRERLR
jgi:hypothetical protein